MASRCKTEEFFFIFAFWILLTPVVVAVTIYGVRGMPFQQLTCQAIWNMGKWEKSELKVTWAKKEKEHWKLIMGKDKDGTTDTFRQPFLGRNTIGNDTHINHQFNGRVNITPSYGLQIEQVRLEDAGTYVCICQNTRTKEQDESDVQLIVFKGTNNNPGNGTGNRTSDSPCKDKEGTKTNWEAVGVWIFLGLFLIALGGLLYLLRDRRNFHHNKVKRDEHFFPNGENRVDNGNTGEELNHYN